MTHVCNLNLFSEANDTVHSHMYLPISQEYRSNYYRCGNGETISILGRCDGEVDCYSGDDEVNCATDTDTCKRNVHVLLFHHANKSVL